MYQTKQNGKKVEYCALPDISISNVKNEKINLRSSSPRNCLQSDHLFHAQYHRVIQTSVPAGIHFAASMASDLFFSNPTISSDGHSRCNKFEKIYINTSQ